MTPHVIPHNFSWGSLTRWDGVSDSPHVIPHNFSWTRWDGVSDSTCDTT